jgi:hypothetical protein
MTEALAEGLLGNGQPVRELDRAQRWKLCPGRSARTTEPPIGQLQRPSVRCGLGETLPFLLCAACAASCHQPRARKRAARSDFSASQFQTRVRRNGGTRAQHHPRRRRGSCVRRHRWFGRRILRTLRHRQDHAPPLPPPLQHGCNQRQAFHRGAQGLSLRAALRQANARAHLELRSRREPGAERRPS